jgi:hypothetical protein
MSVWMGNVVELVLEKYAGEICVSLTKKIGRKHLLNFRHGLVNYIVTDQVECSQRNRHMTYR